jgi:hypothetical protein
MLTRKVTLLVFLASSLSVVKYVLADVEPVDASSEEKAGGQLSPAEILAAKGIQYYVPPNIFFFGPLSREVKTEILVAYGKFSVADPGFLSRIQDQIGFQIQDPDPHKRI